MIFIKQFPICLIAICYLCYIQPISAQKQVLKSPWTLGIDMGLNLNIECSFCGNEPAFISTFASGASIHYRHKRTARTVGFTAHIGYLRQRNTTIKPVTVNWPSFVNNTYYNQNLTLNKITLSVGPKFIHRIGQGDIGFETRIGTTLISAQTQSVSQEYETYNISYNTRYYLFTNLKLDYTYWPKSNFGVSLGIENQREHSSFASIFGGSDFFTPKTPLENSYPNANSQVLSELRPIVKSINLINIVVGISYRFK